MYEPTNRHSPPKRTLAEIRSEYISMAMHEFKTPITAISSSIELLETKLQLDELLLPFYKRNLSRMKEEISTLSNMVEDILIGGNMVSGSPVACPEATDVSAFARMIRKRYFLRRLDNRMLVIKVSGVRRDVYIDQSQLAGILTNIIGNAFKYSNEDNPVLTLYYRKDNLCIKLKDQGIGIPKGYIRYLFTPFSRAGNVGGSEGTGLGLAIVKSFVNANKGTISVKSNSAGTVFTLTFPYATALAGIS